MAGSPGLAGTSVEVERNLGGYGKSELGAPSLSAEPTEVEVLRQSP